ncbi:MAG: hypothetical protein PSV35_05765, partial [bacterium]|nr:hypothetical protein [bacterium]
MDFLSSHENYATSHSLAAVEHVIIYVNGNLSLLRKNGEQNFSEVEKVVTPALEEEYDLLKTLSHISVWLNVIFQSILDDQELLENYEGNLNKIKNHLEELKTLNDQRIKTKLANINQILSVINQTLSSKNLADICQIYNQYLSLSRVINEAYSGQATQLQINGLHEIINHWQLKEQIQWEKTRVLIVITQGPREDLIEKQYFIDLYEKNGIPEAEKTSRHVICVEMLPEQIATVSQD